MINSNYNYSQQLNKKHNSPAFGGPFEFATQALNLLNESPAIGATIVDVGSMAAPRTIVDSKRGMNAGIETGIRETSGSINHAMVGAYGLLGALLAQNLVNKEYGIKASNIKADVQSVNLYSDMWKDFLSTAAKNTSDNNELRANFFVKVLQNTKSLDKNAYGNDFWSKLSPETIEEAKKIVKESLSDSKNEYKLSKKAYAKLKALIVSNTGTEQHVKIDFKEREMSASLDSVLNDTYALSKAFTTDKVKNLYVNNDIKGIQSFLKGFGKYKALSTAVGLGLGCAIGSSVQPLNRYFTKKRTGQDGFVGVDHTNKKESPKALKWYKALAVGAMGLLTYSALGKSPSAFVRRIQFKGLMPTIDQFKLVYGVTIMSRLLAARDTNELRESTFKDFLGYTNWLILGGFVAKLVAKKLNPELLSMPKLPNSVKKKAGSWLTNSTLKTQSEILLSEAKKAKVPIFKDGALRSFKEILKETVKKSPQVKAKIRGVNIAQLAGLLYSGVVLGWAIPKINIWVTNKINQKEVKPQTIEEIHANRIKVS